MTASLGNPEILGHDLRRRGERALDVPKVDAGFGNNVVRTIDSRPRRAWLNGRTRIDNSRQCLIIEIDRRCRVLGQCPALRNNENDRLTDIGHFPFDEHRQIDVEINPSARDGDWDSVAGVAGAQIRIRKDRPHARHPAGALEPDVPDQSMRNRAPQKVSMQHAGQMNVIDEASLATQQRRIFDPRNISPNVMIAVWFHSQRINPQLPWQAHAWQPQQDRRSCCPRATG